MPPIPKAVRVRTATGWQDIAIVGPPGAPASQVPQIYLVTSGYTVDRAFNPESTSLTELARVLGTLIDDLKASGVIKP